jgi:hypothetical protein
MPTYTIYPNYDAFYSKNAKDFRNARVAKESDSFDDTSQILDISALDNGTDIDFTRTYLRFNLSSVIGAITNMSLNIFTETVIGDYIAVTYSGTRIFENNTDYSTYINEGSIEWAARDVLKVAQYNEIILDKNLYPFPNQLVSPNLVIGLIDVNDFDNSEIVGNFIRIFSVDSPDRGRRPFLTVTSELTGYPNKVIGVQPISISNVNGTNISNISKINVI